MFNKSILGNIWNNNNAINKNLKVDFKGNLFKVPYYF